MASRSPSIAASAACLLLALIADPRLVSARTVTVELVSGDRVTGELVESSDARTVLEHPVFGRLVIPAAQKRPEDPPRSGLFGTRFLEGWKREIGFGLSGSEGNSPESSLRGKLSLSRRTEDLRWTIDGSYKLALEGGAATDHFGRLDSRRDWLFRDSDWFAFAGTTYQFDEFEPWKHRLQVQLGPGRHLIRDDSLELDGFLGLSLTYEFGDVRTLRPEGLLGLELSWAFRDGMELSFSNRLFPQLDSTDIRNLTRAEWKMRIAGFRHLSLTLGFDNEYDSAALEEPNSLKYWSSIDYDF
ncbi:MAG: DUF481 domain-containing protein [Myxococcota bacterium]|nr:DUF481 domain-containing protein [Myxococcota bacterium]